ncbi:PAS domain S-box-containing protein/diguanylate cyclase (GGDEF)-like protein [Sulfuritortus calidifontis]|uniref:PAS domain S-box-containing protein/diguanylate cyclase (GGDEF)-like protein n=1 Tax=Sulfuritortus calidifontis TaxID=1914471 RepID=A0A4R3JYC7_9PROT|nr:EAL domain-containing protein [Sulfuritortus calidifontis]TCS73803.1 PAS domain S-box-containing protein/diguanylate cyclase (GGDEF)-like protein [Sulfuritortus calidifontis]
MKAHLPKVSLKFAILAPLTLSLTALVAIFTYSFARQEEAFTRDFVDGAFAATQRAYASAMADETEKLSTALALIVRDAGLARAMQRQDRALLLQHSQPTFDYLRRESGITHFYFHTPDRINFLRVHQPERFGDKIDRYTAIKAEASGQPAAGLELGPLGTFTLRVVFPWYQDGRLIGYVELGQEIEQILGRISSLTGIDLYLTIDKRHLSRKDWQAGMAMLGRTEEWDMLREAVVTYRPETVSADTTRKLLAHDLSHAHNRTKVTSGDQVLQALTLPIGDVSGREVGHLLMARDITNLNKNNRQQTLIVGSIGLAIGGGLLGLFSLLIGRVERRLADSTAALLESEQRFRTLVESVNDWIWEIDADWRYVYVSPKVEEILGYKPDEILGLRPFDLMPPSEAEQLSRRFEAIAAEGKPFTSMENRNLHKDGRLVILETSATPIFREDGSLCGYRGVDRDVTERWLAKEALDQTTQRLNRHFQQTPLAVIEWDADFRVLDWNPSAEAIFGYTKAETIGRHAMELIVPESATDHVAKVWGELLGQGGGFRSSNENVTKSGKIITCEWYNTPLVDDNGRVIGVASLAQDITEQRQAEQRLNHLAYYDALTSLPNRALFQDRLGQAIATASRHQKLVGVMLMDLDQFKVINDTLGHETGNALLQAVADRLKHCLRESDTVARLGGDEFAIALTDISTIEDVVQIAQKVLDEFVCPFTIAGKELFVSASIGITLYPFDGSDASLLLRNADSAMYHAKDCGRKTFQFYSAEMTARVEKRLTMETELRHALERGELELHYQPQLDIATGRIVGMEALVRWRHPQKGMMPPAEFIPIAEESGLIVPIGEWIMRTACRQAMAWQAQGLPELQLAINLSARQFKPELAGLVKEVLAETGLPARCLELEITESLFIEGTDSETASILAHLKALGVSLAIDDFGTGYSSLSYLKCLPVNKLKIDQSFVQGISSNPEDASLVKAIIAIARSLNLRVIAEGVETEAQLHYLREHGCDYMQGYYYSRALPAGAFVELVKPAGA